MSSAEGSQYPAWLGASWPETPDRTKARRGQGEDPTPWLGESARRITGEGRADFVVVCCHTAHAFLKGVQAELEVPILDMVEDKNPKQSNQNCDGLTPLPRVSIFGNTEIIAMIPDVVEDKHQKDKYGRTALYYAELLVNQNICEMIRAAQEID